MRTCGPCASPGTLTDPWDQVTGFPPLCRAARAAAHGKRLQPDAQAFLVDLEPNVFRLQEQLQQGTWRPGPLRSFRIRDPKPRLISAAPFVDRVVHHAVCTAIGPILEADASDHSFACRTGRGTHAALRRAHMLTAQFPCYYKLDIRHYFETIDHASILNCLGKYVADGAVLDVLGHIVAAGAPGSEPGRGMPIGNLTSQYFANLVLGEVDAAVADLPALGGYVRYMDDMLFFGESHAVVRAAALIAETVAEATLRLAIKREATRHGQATDGVPFLGMRLFPTATRLDAARRRRLVRKLRTCNGSATCSTADAALAARQAESLIAWAHCADTTALRRVAANPRRQ